MTDIDTTALSGSDDVLGLIDYNSGDFDTDKMTNAILDADDEIYNKYSRPLASSRFLIDGVTLKYEFRKNNKETYRLDQVIIRLGDNDRTVLTESLTGVAGATTYVKDLIDNTITISTTTRDTSNGRWIEVDYVPMRYHILSKNKGALNLLDSSDVINGTENMPANIRRIVARIKRIEGDSNSVVAVGSDENRDYDPRDMPEISQVEFKVY